MSLTAGPSKLGELGEAGGNWADQSHQLRAIVVEKHGKCASRGTTITLPGNEASLNQHMDMESETGGLGRKVVALVIAAKL